MLNKFLEANIKSLDKDKGTFEVLASSGKQDRFGDTIDPKGWYLKNYKKNPVILWSHSAGGFLTTAIPPVAKAVKVWVENEKELRIKGEWADTPFAQELRTLVEGDFLNAVSVGFMPLVAEVKGNIEIEGKMYRRATDEEIEKGMYGKGGEHFAKQELLEVSWVDVPALPEALVSARKMNLGLVTKALESIGDEMVIKPYANEHSCRLEDPGKYKRLRRKNCEVKSDGKCIDVVYGVTKGEEEKTERQALRYDKKVWTAADAKSHCKENDGTFEPASEESAGKTVEEKLDLFEKHLTKVEKAISVLMENSKVNPEKSTTPLEVKGRKPSIKQKSRKSNMERLLIMFDKMGEILLKELRQQNEK